MEPRRSWIQACIIAALTGGPALLYCSLVAVPLLALPAGLVLRGPVFLRVIFFILSGGVALTAMTITAIYTARGFRRELRAQDQERAEYWEARNRCRRCGYILRGILQTSSQCPECGYIIRKR